MIDLPTDLPAELVPLSWLIGVWEGDGRVEYRLSDDERVEAPFHQRVSFSHDGLPYLNYTSSTWTDGPDGAAQPLASESGYWRLSRVPVDGDPGPALLPATGPRPFTTADEVEQLRNARGGFDIEVSLVHPAGVTELYLGAVQGGRIDLATDAVMRTESAKEYSAATRLYGLVEGDLLWAWDIAALGRELRTHASGTLRRVD